MARWVRRPSGPSRHGDSADPAVGWIRFRIARSRSTHCPFARASSPSPSSSSFAVHRRRRARRAPVDRRRGRPEGRRHRRPGRQPDLELPVARRIASRRLRRPPAPRSSRSTRRTRRGRTCESAVNGANVIVYFGHGNGYPNPYTLRHRVHRSGQRLGPQPHDDERRQRQLVDDDGLLRREGAPRDPHRLGRGGAAPVLQRRTDHPAPPASR